MQTFIHVIIEQKQAILSRVILLSVLQPSQSNKY